MNDSQKFFLQLIEHALTGEHAKFEQLRFFDDYLGARITSSATDKVIKLLIESANNLFKTYCKTVRYRQADFNMLLAYKQIQQAINFYKEEQKIVSDALTDYEGYLLAGNFLRAFFGEERDI